MDREQHDLVNQSSNSGSLVAADRQTCGSPSASSDPWFCTRSPGHGGDHCATVPTGRVVATWPQGERHDVRCLVDSLYAENSRLRAAGDALAEAVRALSHSYCGDENDEDLVDAWEEACREQ